MDAVIDEMPHTYAHYSNGLEKLKVHYKRQKLRGVVRQVKVYVAWGTPGSGKSYWADRFRPETTFTLPDQGRGTVWFDGYDGEKVLLIEDFEGKINYRSLLRYLDNYPLRVQTGS